MFSIGEVSAKGIFRFAKKEGTIHYGYKNWGTHVFPNTSEGEQ